MKCQRDLFELPDDISYLNCAYMSPQLRRVEAVGHAMVSLKNRPYLIHPEDFFTTVRELKALFAQLINASDPDRIAIIPSVSYGVANVAQNLSLSTGQRIVVAGDQFPSNYYSWKRLADRSGAAMHVVAAPDSARRTEAWNTALLDAIGADTAVVALSHTHWADGARFDLAAIGARCREVGARFVIDGTQSVGALPFDVREYQPDALICAGYKWLLGPYGLGLAYYGPVFDEGLPIEENWINRRESEDFQHLVHYRDEYQPRAGRYSVGEQSNFILVPMLREAIGQLLAWDVGAIQAYTRELSREPLLRLQEMGARVEPEEQRCGHLFGVRLGDQFDSGILRDQFRARQVFVSLRGDAIRISPHVYNRPADFDALLACFTAARRRVRQTS